MKAHVEAWARYCATHKATPRRTLADTIARNKAVLQFVPSGRRCAVCDGWLQVGYKALIPTKDNERTLTVEYIHTKPEWCERATEATALQALLACVRRWQVAIETVDGVYEAEQSLLKAVKEYDERQ